MPVVITRYSTHEVCYQQTFVVDEDVVNEVTAYLKAHLPENVEIPTLNSEVLGDIMYSCDDYDDKYKKNVYWHYTDCHGEDRVYNSRLDEEIRDYLTDLIRDQPMEVTDSDEYDCSYDVDYNPIIH